MNEGYAFRISFMVTETDDMENTEFFDAVEEVAEKLHANESLFDVSVGVDAESRHVEFELGALARSVNQAYEVALLAIRDAIESVGGEVESFSLPTTFGRDPGQEAFDFFAGDRFFDRCWRETGAELVDA